MSVRTEPSTLSVAILGVDAVVAAHPASAIQLAHAVLAAGYDAVYPVTWGDELVAAGCLQRLAERDGAPAILCACPLVAARLLRSGEDLARFLVPLISPPAAVARYVRALHEGRRVHITYMGGCPDAESAEIDAHLSPAALDAALRARRIVVTRQPQYFESVLPPDRRRFYSLPGGAPAPNWLRAAGQERTLITLAGEDMAAELAQALLTGERTLIDLAPMLGCPCSGASAETTPDDARQAAAGGDPPRANGPVIDSSLPIELDRELPSQRWHEPEWGEEDGSPMYEEDGEDAPGDVGESVPAPQLREEEHATVVGEAEREPEADVERGGDGDEEQLEILHSYSRRSVATGRNPRSASPSMAGEAPGEQAGPTAPRPVPPLDAASIEFALERLTAISLIATVQQEVLVSPEAADAQHGVASGEATQPAERATPGGAVESELAGEAPTAADGDARHDASDEVPAPAESERGTTRRLTPASVRRVGGAPTVRIGSGRPVPRAYATHRRGSAAAPADAAPAERETEIRRAFEPMAPPADFRPPIAPRDRARPERPDANAATAAPRTASSAAPRADRAPLSPRPPGMVPHRTTSFSVGGSRTRLGTSPSRRRNRSRGVIIAVAAIAIGALSILAVRHLALRDDGATLDAATVSETSGVIVSERDTSPAAAQQGRDDAGAPTPATADRDAETGVAGGSGEPPAPPPASPHPTPGPQRARQATTRIASPARRAAGDAGDRSPQTAERSEQELRSRQMDSLARALDSQRALRDPDD